MNIETSIKTIRTLTVYGTRAGIERQYTFQVTGTIGADIPWTLARNGRTYEIRPGKYDQDTIYGVNATGKRYTFLKYVCEV